MVVCGGGRFLTCHAAVTSRVARRRFSGVRTARTRTAAFHSGWSPPLLELELTERDVLHAVLVIDLRNRSLGRTFRGSVLHEVVADADLAGQMKTAESPVIARCATSTPSIDVHEMWSAWGVRREHAMFVFIALFPLGLLAVVMLLARLERGLTSEARRATESSTGAVLATGRNGRSTRATRTV